MRLSTLLIISYVMIELLCSSIFISHVGFLLFILEVILSAILGGILLLRADIGLMKMFNNLLANTIFDSFSIFKGIILSFARYIGAFCLIIPGIFSDIIGVMFLMFSILYRFNAPNQTSDWESKWREANNARYNGYKHRPNNEDIIDVEVIDTDQKNINKD